jgi:hypothetical protein
VIHRFAVPVGLVVLCASAAPALANPSNHTADVELVQTSLEAGKSVRRTMVFTVSLVDDAAPAKVSSRVAEGTYEISLRRESAARNKAKQPILWLELGRHAARGPESLTVEATSSAVVGQRAVMLALDRGDGTKVEVAVTLR